MPFGRYRWKRLPYGIKMAPEVFQQAMHNLIIGLKGTEVIADDFLIFGADVKERDANLHAFLKRCKERNIVLNFDKLTLHHENVPFIGHVATSEGLKAAPEKVNAILHMLQPTNAVSLRRFLSMVQYLVKFVPRLSDMTQLLHILTQKNIEFSWNTAQ